MVAQPPPARFPRGLIQAEGANRFAADALLLAAFAARGSAKGPALELGTGCGAALFGLLLLRSETTDMTGAGCDIHAPSLEAARENAVRLGLADCADFFVCDLADPKAVTAAIAPGAFGLVLANPPWRLAGTGRVPPQSARLDARFETAASLDHFLDAARRALAPRGRVCVVHLSERLPGLLAAMTARGLTPVRLRLVHGRAETPAKLVLVEGRKGVRGGLLAEPPVVLYEPDDGSGNRQTNRLTNRLTSGAREFCPFLDTHAS